MDELHVREGRKSTCEYGMVLGLTSDAIIPGQWNSSAGSIQKLLATRSAENTRLIPVSQKRRGEVPKQSVSDQPGLLIINQTTNHHENDHTQRKVHSQQFISCFSQSKYTLVHHPLKYFQHKRLTQTQTNVLKTPSPALPSRPDE